MTAALAIKSDLPSPEAYFEASRAAFERAAAATSDLRRFYKIGTEILCLRFAGDALMPLLTEALSHLEVPAAPPALTILCWDSGSTKTAMPPPPWPLTAYGAKGHIEGYNTDNIHTLYQPGADILNLMNRAQRLGIYWMEHPGILPYWERSFPMRGQLHWWSQDHAFQLVHAAAVGNDKGGVLMAGKGGSGKSTTAVTCLNSPMQYAGDDYVLISPEPAPRVYSLYNAAKLGPKSLAMLPQMAAKISNPDFAEDEKGLLFLHKHFPEKMCAGFPAKALFLPRVIPGATDTHLRPASATEGLLALAPTTVMQLEGGSKLAFDKMQRFVKSIPVFHLDLGSDLGQIPGIISRFLEEA